MAFFDAVKTSGDVFRYTIFNRYGYSILIAEQDKVTPTDLSDFRDDAIRSIKEDRPLVDVRAGRSPGQPAYFAEAFVPVRVNGSPVAVVAAYVDQTAARDNFYRAFLIAAASLCLLTGSAFALPAVAWYKRTKEKEHADRRIRFLAHHDSLTGLPNRAQLIERLEYLLAVLSSSGGMLAVHFIDIDHFKYVNDSIGHDGGDFLLSTIGKRFTALTRSGDVVARLGGDEFILVQSAITGKLQAETFARRIVTILSAPMYFKEQEIIPHFTIGVALAPTDGATAERLLKSADLALYNGKGAGRNCIRFFTTEMDVVLQERIKLEKIIRDAVANDEFALHYQPSFEVIGKHLIGFEALARLPDGHGGFISPATFIPMAEEMRVIDKLGAWVLREACRTATTWPEDLTVAVNLSPAQFELGLVEQAVADALKESGLQPHRLELEITETLLLRNDAHTIAILGRLKDMGVSIVMDDFGTGYSSLSYLWKFPFDKIKIDRSFMESFKRAGRDVETVVKTIIALGREMNMRVTVEGVETPEQADFLYDAHADQVQGFYFGRPVPASEIAADLLKRVHEPPRAASALRDGKSVAAQSSKHG